MTAPRAKQFDRLRLDSGATVRVCPLGYAEECPVSATGNLPALRAVTGESITARGAQAVRSQVDSRTTGLQARRCLYWLLLYFSIGGTLRYSLRETRVSSPPVPITSGWHGWAVVALPLPAVPTMAGQKWPTHLPIYVLNGPTIRKMAGTR